MEALRKKLECSGMNDCNVMSVRYIRNLLPLLQKAEEEQNTLKLRLDDSEYDRVRLGEEVRKAYALKSYENCENCHWLSCEKEKWQIEAEGLQDELTTLRGKVREFFDASNNWSHNTERRNRYNQAREALIEVAGGEG